MGTYNPWLSERRKLTYHRRQYDSFLAMMPLRPSFDSRDSFTSITSDTNISSKGPSLLRESTDKKVSLSSRVFEIPLSFGKFRVRISTHVVKPRGPTSEVSLIQRLRQQQITTTFIPAGLLSSVLEWTFSRGYCPQATFKIFHLRPSGSEVFRCTALGHVNKLRLMIEEGAASPNDVDEDGWTLLHVRRSSELLTFSLLTSIDLSSMPLLAIML